MRFALRDQDAQVLPLIAIVMVGILGMAALVADVGDVYYSFNELQDSTNAAAMAGAEGLPYNSTTTNQAAINAEQYSSDAGQLNAFGNLNASKPTITLGCLTTGLGASIPCVPTGVGTGTANVVQVKQTATVKTYFAVIFGQPTVTLTATGTALMKGTATVPYNVAIVIDTTASMDTSDTNCGKNMTRLQCALGGVQTLLQELTPCSASGCGSLSNGNYANALDRVALFTFPEASSGTTMANNYNCSGKSPSITPYTFPSATGTTYTPGTSSPTYQVTPYMSNYRSSDDSSSLSTSSGSDVVLATGAESGCGMQDPGGEGTYYAGVIYAAQASLLGQQAINTANGQDSKNIMILVSDGAATSSKSQMSSSGLLSSGVYPSYNDECQQAVTAADAATAQGTTVYSIAYGSQSSGCTTDSGTYGSPCATMAGMASTPAQFYSDYLQSGSGSSCESSNSVSDMNGIFHQIVETLSAARLVPNSVFPSS
jgi:hypothetical protein